MPHGTWNMYEISSLKLNFVGKYSSPNQRIWGNDFQKDYLGISDPNLY